MSEASDVAKVASSDIEKYLLSLPETIIVVNTEDDKDFQLFDVDIIQEIESAVILIEIKGDRMYRTGNFFFETTSNTDKNTLGCFLYTLADFIYYYYVEEKKLFILPMPETCEWFKVNIHRFKERTTSTSFDNGDSYSTIGRIVPRETVIKEVKGVKVVSLTKVLKV